MEDGVFHHQEVSELLRERFVEARLHVDYPENMERELAMVQSNAQPIYVVIDPADPERIHARFDGALAPGQPDTPFIEFLNEGWERARGATAGAQ